MLKRTQIVLIPTKNELRYGDIVTSPRFPNRLLRFGTFENSYTNECIKQELYFISDDEIKKDDCFILKPELNVKKSTQDLPIRTREWMKIIATTNSSLKISIDTIKHNPKKTDIMSSLPKPSETFIKKYIEEYNRNNQIVEVNVEYSSYINTKGEILLKIPKINSKDNTITILPIEGKTTYTKEEVIELCKKSWNQGFFVGREMTDEDDFDKFISENLN